MLYFLTWYNKLGDSYIGECLLPNVNEADVRREFDLDADEPPGDCVAVGSDHLGWLRSVATGVRVDLVSGCR